MSGMPAKFLVFSAAILAVSVVFGKRLQSFDIEAMVRSPPSGQSEPEPTRAARQSAAAWQSPAPQGSFGGLGDERFAADAYGHFHGVVEIGGARIPVLIDTGATSIALSAEHAAKAGLRPQKSQFTQLVSTANGIARVAPVKLRSVRLGSIVLYDVDAAVAEPGAMPGESLLGMSFLSRLRMETSYGSLRLRQ